MLEPRLMEIEIKLTRQEDMLEALNQVVYQQQKQIDELHSMCAALAGHLAQRADQRGDAAAPDERPPHY
jgi:SlyX protein